MRWKERSEQELPKEMKSRTASDEPSLAVPKMLSVLPSRPKDRTLSELPNATKSKHESVEPRRAMP